MDQIKKSAVADDDDVDLFDDEVDEEAERIKAERLAAYHAKKVLKAPIAAKSKVKMEIKPLEEETDMNLLTKQVRAITMDSLKWLDSELQPVAYGIMKLVISCEIEDEKVSTDTLVEIIEGFEEQVQSVEIIEFNKM